MRFDPKIFRITVLAVLFMSSVYQSSARDMAVMMPRSVDQEIFRSRWIGEQMDREVTFDTPVWTEYEEAVPQAKYVPLLDKEETPLGGGLHFGSLEIRPSIEFGWEYSSRSDTGTTTDSASDNSFYMAPAIALNFDREVGPWTVAFGYAAGYIYYFNDNYRSGGTGNSRNPFQQTLSLSIGVEGSRYHLRADAGASYGTGFDVEAGENNTQFNLTGSLSGDYIVSEWITVGSNLQTRQNIASDASDSPNSELSFYGASIYANYLWTGKTTLQYELSAGRNGQSIASGGGQVSRQYLQSMFRVTYVPTGKITLTGAVGLRYVDATDIEEPEDVGFQPAYAASINYRPTEKITIALSSSLEGADLRPKLRAAISWQPRVETGFALAVYQDQNFSSVLDSQVRVTRGVVGTVSQRFFGCVYCDLSAGYEQWYYVDASGSSENDEDIGDQYSRFVSLSVTWQIKEWMACRALLWAGSDQGGSNNSPGLRASVGMNFGF